MRRGREKGAVSRPRRREGPVSCVAVDHADVGLMRSVRCKINSRLDMVAGRRFPACVRMSLRAVIIAAIIMIRLESGRRRVTA